MHVEFVERFDSFAKIRSRELRRCETSGLTAAEIWARDFGSGVGELDVKIL
jgi:hypothetical protein